MKEMKNHTMCYTFDDFGQLYDIHIYPNSILIEGSHQWKWRWVATLTYVRPNLNKSLCWRIDDKDDGIDEVIKFIKTRGDSYINMYC